MHPRFLTVRLSVIILSSVHPQPPFHILFFRSLQPSQILGNGGRKDSGTCLLSACQGTIAPLASRPPARPPPASPVVVSLRPGPADRTVRNTVQAPSSHMSSPGLCGPSGRSWRRRGRLGPCAPAGGVCLVPLSSWAVIVASLRGRTVGIWFRIRHQGPAFPGIDSGASIHIGGGGALGAP